jgi:hypothetical protein
MVAAFEAGRNDQNQPGFRGEGNPRRNAADASARKHFIVDREIRSFDDDPAAFDGGRGMNGRQRHGRRKVEVGSRSLRSSDFALQTSAASTVSSSSTFQYK